MGGRQWCVHPMESLYTHLHFNHLECRVKSPAKLSNLSTGLHQPNPDVFVRDVTFGTPHRHYVPILYGPLISGGPKLRTDNSVKKVKFEVTRVHWLLIVFIRFTMCSKVEILRSQSTNHMAFDLNLSTVWTRRREKNGQIKHLIQFQ